MALLRTWSASWYCRLPDKWSHAWLQRSNNPYAHEIETMADILGIRGVYTFNGSYEWGCTSGAYRMDESVVDAARARLAVSRHWASM